MYVSICTLRVRSRDVCLANTLACVFMFCRYVSVNWRLIPSAPDVILFVVPSSSMLLAGMRDLQRPECAALSAQLDSTDASERETLRQSFAASQAALEKHISSIKQSHTQAVGSALEVRTRFASHQINLRF